MVSKMRPFDVAEMLDSDEAIIAFLDEVLESGEAQLVAQSLGVVARARGMTQVARDAGLTRESLYKALSTDGNPEFATIIKVLAALRLRLSVTAA